MITQESLQRNPSAIKTQVSTSCEITIREVASRIAQFSQLPSNGHERRSQDRVSYPKLIPLTPLCTDMLTPAGAPFYVVGKDLASLGLDFYHHEPITHRYGLVSLESAPDQCTHFVLKLSWCRFLHPGWYDSGGRFIKVFDDEKQAARQEKKNTIDSR